MKKTAQDNGYPPVLKMGIYATVIINQIYIMGIYWPRSLSWDIEPAKQGLECGGYSMEHNRRDLGCLKIGDTLPKRFIHIKFL